MKTNILSVLIISFLFFGCQRGKVKNNLLPGVSGKAGEVLIVINKTHWESEPGTLFKDDLLQATPGLPQDEPIFNPIHIPRKAFTELFKIHRNIIITHIEQGLSKNFSVSWNKWASPQLVITMQAPNKAEFVHLYKQNQDKLLGLLFKAERDRLTDNYKKYREKVVIDKLKNSMKVHLTIPKGYRYDLDTNNFVWISHETPQISQGIFVYHYPYNDTAAFLKQNLIAKRNEMLKKYVSGPTPGSYMTTEDQLPPEFRSYKWKGKYTAELRGLWKVHGDFMGGPFVSISQIDEYRNRIVTVEGFVYAPKFNKRNYVRQIEAILYSLDFPPPKDQQEKK
jgi:hypothetical protein